VDAEAEREARIRPASIVDLDAGVLPFEYPVHRLLPPAQPRLVRIRDLHEAFPNRQTAGTRLILTQSTYLLQKWIDALGERDVIVATAEREALDRNAPEARAGRGPWRRFTFVSADDTIGDARGRSNPAFGAPERTSATHRGGELALLVDAYRSAAPADRLRLCGDAAALAPDSPVAWLALASARREMQDAAGAANALERALALAPDWEAAHYEQGKLWLSCENMARARDAFERATELMPTFAAAFSNLGATLGELDQPDAAVSAFERALASDPDSFTILNNIGVVNRELGRLDASESALRRVNEIAPDFIFGHYNLGHTLFLKGDFAGSVKAYEDGQRRDPGQNRRQGCRLAVARFASGDPEGAQRELWRHADSAPPDEREDLLLEAFEIAHAILQSRPELAMNKGFLDRIAAELGRGDDRAGGTR
jgi:tetratricopeptide (TPR) repeat protein